MSLSTKFLKGRVSEMTKGNFSTYLRYKLSKCRVLIVFYTVINFLSVFLPSMLFNKDMKELAEYVSVADSGLVYGTTWEFSLQILVLMIPLNIIIITISTVKSLRIYHKLAEMDTLGCLPISYRDRFWGDFLSGIISNLVSFIPFAVAALFFIDGMKEPIEYVAESKFRLDYYLPMPGIFLGFIIMMLIVYIGVYAVTTFVSSCCGKVGNSVLFSFIAMIVLPGIFWIYGDYFFSRIVGVDAVSELSRIICILPPLGPLISQILFVNAYGWFSDSSRMIIMDTPMYIAVYVLFIALFIVGAFYIGKRRRAENVGEGFVFGGAYHALIITFLIALIGFSMLKFDEFLGGIGIVFTLVLTFIVYAALELAQHKNVKKLWKTAVRFAAVFGVCFGFYFIVKSTNSFDMYKKLPSESSVECVEISGRYFYTPFRDYFDRKYAMNSDEFISGIINEHETLLESGDLVTGDDLVVTYVMKNGHKMTRSYSVSRVSEEDPIKDFSDAAKALPNFEWGDFGILDLEDLSDYVITYSVSRYVQGDGSIVDGVIQREKLPHMIELLKEDLKAHYDKNMRYNGGDGHIKFTNKYDNHVTTGGMVLFRIDESYTETYKFVNDLGNYAEDIEEDEELIYRFYYSDENITASVFVSSEDTSEAAQLLMFYLQNYTTKNNGGNGYSSIIRITEQKYSTTYRMDVSVEEDVIKAILELFREQNVG